MKFKFSYEKLLEYNKQQEEIARRDYVESLNRLDAERQKQMQMYHDHDEALDEIFRLQNDPKGAPIARLDMLDQYVEGQKIRIARQRDVIVNYTMIVEQKQDILIAAAKEYQVLEKLKEKKFADFKRIQKKKEAKINDELVVTRFRRGDST